MTHHSLARLLLRLGLSEETPPVDTALWKAFVQKLSKIYEEHDQERSLNERSLMLSSQELNLLNEGLEKKVNEKTQVILNQRAGLENASKLATLGEMAGEIAHEINNPLTVICGKVDQMKRKIDAGTIDTEKMKEGLILIKTTSARITKIIKGLRSFSRNSENDPLVPTSIRVMIEDTLVLCKERFSSSSVELIVEFEGDVTVECRPSQISQVVMNLLGNAHDAIENRVEKWVKLRVTYDDKIARISVTDCGRGIPPEILEKIMQPYFTTKELGKGTGLGLSISKGIIENHAGKFYYDSESPNTSFVIEIPLRPLPLNPSKMIFHPEEH